LLDIPFEQVANVEKRQFEAAKNVQYVAREQ
jgi:hypothetical protein